MQDISANHGYEVIRVEAPQVLQLRHRVLNPKGPESSIMFPEDTHATTLHFAAHRTLSASCSYAIVACVTLMVQPLEDFMAWRIRAMAVDPKLQRQGFGKKVLSTGLGWLVDHGWRDCLVWATVRVEAIGFYKRFGLVVDSPQFDHGFSGPSVRMCKYNSDASDVRQIPIVARKHQDKVSPKTRSCDGAWYYTQGYKDAELDY
jgi:GNAT superfamily N-acetyltransferase